MKTRDFAKVIKRQLQNDPKLREDVEREMLRGQLAVLVYQARTKAGMTQANLAKLAGVTQAAICKIETTDYQNLSLRMLAKIAAVFGQRVKVTFEKL